MIEYLSLLLWFSFVESIFIVNFQTQLNIDDLK